MLNEKKTLFMSWRNSAIKELGSMQWYSTVLTSQWWLINFLWIWSKFHGFFRWFSRHFKQRERGFSYSTNLKLVSFNEWNYTIFWQFYYCLSISRLGSFSRLKCEKSAIWGHDIVCVFWIFFRQSDETIQNIDFFHWLNHVKSCTIFPFLA